MGSGIISKYRLCVYFQKFRDDERYIKQFLLFNTNQYFQRDLSIAIEGRNGKTLYLPAQSELATIPTNNSIAVRYQGKYFLFPTNTSMWSTVCMVQLYSYTTESGRWIRGNFQYSIGGNTVGLNYKIKIEAYNEV